MPISTDSITVDQGKTFKEILHQFPTYQKSIDKILTVSFNNRPVNLHSCPKYSGTLSPIYYNSMEGNRIYQQTLVFMLCILWQKLFPSKRLIVGQSIANGVYFSIEETRNISPKLLAQLKNELDSLIAKDLPILPEYIPYFDALELLTKQHNTAAVELLKFRNEETLLLHRCDNFLDLATPPLLHRTGKIHSYELESYAPGFLLKIPCKKKLENKTRIDTNRHLFNIHTEYRRWSKILNITNVGELNELIDKGKLKHFIQINEMLQENKISAIAEEIFKREEKLKLILIAGPSSSGKTTFTKKLALHLTVLGMNPSIIEMDNFFVPKKATPIDKDGKPDYESINAINIELLNNHMLDLFASKEVEIPIYDFILGHPREKGELLKLQNDGILIMEGIHGLNDKLTEKISRNEKFLIYVSALTQLKLDDHNRIPTTDGRLLRRMVRDSQFRGQDPSMTFEMWPRVRRGEDENIFPFQGNADAVFNSALNYEIPVLKVFASPLLRKIKVDDPAYGEALRLHEFLKNFLDIPPEDVPRQSILREFIGGSSFNY